MSGCRSLKKFWALELDSAISPPRSLPPATWTTTLGWFESSMATSSELVATVPRKSLGIALATLSAVVPTTRNRNTPSPVR